MSKPLNAWMEHVKKTRDANPGMGLKDILVKAKATYKKDKSSKHKHHGGVLMVFGGKKKAHRGGLIPIFGGEETEEQSAMAQTGGSAPAPLNPEDVSGMPNSSGTALQIQATQFSGGKKSKRRSGSHKRGHKSHKRSHKRSGSHKRRHH